LLFQGSRNPETHRTFPAKSAGAFYVSTTRRGSLAG
jgi:hypothetical protein